MTQPEFKARMRGVEAKLILLYGHESRRVVDIREHATECLFQTHDHHLCHYMQVETERSLGLVESEAVNNQGGSDK